MLCIRVHISILIIRPDQTKPNIVRFCLVFGFVWSGLIMSTKFSLMSTKFGHTIWQTV